MDPCKNAQMPTGNVFKLFQNMRLIQQILLYSPTKNLQLLQNLHV